MIGHWICRYDSLIVSQRGEAVKMIYWRYRMKLKLDIDLLR